MGKACGRLEFGAAAFPARTAALRRARALRAGRLKLAAAVGTTSATATSISAAAVAARALAATACSAAIASTIPAASTAAALGGLGIAHALQHLGAGGLGGCLHHIAAGRLAGAAPDGLAAHGNGLCAFAWLGRKALDHFDLNLLLGEALDVLHEAFFIQTHQVHRCAVGPRPAGAADAVHIVFADVRDFIVHHVRQVVNVDTAGGNIGGHQRAHFAALEARQRLGARCLAFVAVQGHGSDAIFFKEFGHVVGAELGPRKNQHLAPVLLVDDVGQQRLFLTAAHRMDDLGDALHRGVARGDLYALRILEQAVGKLADLVAESGREQQALLFLGHQRQHFLYIVDEAHVQHAVGFIEHQDLHLAQIQHALLRQIQQAAGGGHQNIHALLDLGDLRVHAHAAKDDGGAELQVFAVGLHRLFHLRCQLAGGSEHQGSDADTAKLILCAAAHGEAVQKGQGESGSLAGAGLGAAQQVVPLEHQGNGLRLDGGGGFVTLLAHGLHDGGCQLQFFKVHG